MIEVCLATRSKNGGTVTPVFLSSFFSSSSSSVTYRSY